MNEEKKLNDEALEGVNGGLDNLGIFLRAFLLSNCVNCARNGADCPYHGDLSQIRAAYESGTDTCREKRPA